MHSGSMPDALTSKSWLLIVLCSAGFSLIPWVAPASAARLMDIRIGEYETFTRIVFELDAAIEEPGIFQTPDGLKVVFADTRPDLIRKVPFEGSRGLGDMQIRTGQKALSVIFQLGTRPEQTASFQLRDPPRVVMDVHWPGSGPNTQAPPVSAPQARSVEQALAAGASPTSPTYKIPLASSDPVPAPVSGRSIRSETINASPSRYKVRESGSTVSLQQRIETRPEADAPITRANAAPGPKRLQFYLVTALVVITIAILVLLALMLLSRHRWVHDDGPLSAKEYLRSQDERIAMIDARIQEQMKRYDQA
jgi:hypothetical protein